jgi:hypothetical protein
MLNKCKHRLSPGGPNAQPDYKRIIQNEEDAWCKNHFMNMLYTWLTPMQNSLLLFLLLYALSSSSSSMLCIHHANVKNQETDLPQNASQYAMHYSVL